MVEYVCDITIAVFRKEALPRFGTRELEPDRSNKGELVFRTVSHGCVRLSEE